MTAPAALSIVVVTYNSEADIGSCLDAIQSDGLLSPLPCIVVDNFSTDGTWELLRAQPGQRQLVQSGRNGGFGAAVNLGATYVRTPFFLVINPDVLLNGPSVHAMLEAIGTDAQLAALGCRLIYPDGSMQYACRTFPTVCTFVGRSLPSEWFGGGRYMARHLMKELTQDSIPSDRAVHLVDWVLGGCCLFRMQAFSAIGPFDEQYFMYYEDIDWCFRARLAGWRIGHITYAEIVHAYKRQSSRYSLKNRLTLVHGTSAIRFFSKYFLTRRLRTLV